MAIFPPLNVFAKSPRQMAREAEAQGRAKRPQSKPVAIDPEVRPLLDGANFGAWLRAGRFDA